MDSSGCCVGKAVNCLACINIPYCGPLVATARGANDQLPAVGREREIPGVHSIPKGLSCSAPIGATQTERGAGTAGEHLLAVGREGRAAAPCEVRVVLVPGQTQHLLAGLEVPQVNSRGAVADEKVLAVGREGDVLDRRGASPSVAILPLPAGRPRAWPSRPESRQANADCPGKRSRRTRTSWPSGSIAGSRTSHSTTPRRDHRQQ